MSHARRPSEPTVRVGFEEIVENQTEAVPSAGANNFLWFHVGLHLFKAAKTLETTEEQRLSSLKQKVDPDLSLHEYFISLTLSRYWRDTFYLT